jgi:hypothetical protein
MFKNLVKVLKSKIWIFGIILGVVIIAIPSYYFFDKQMIIWNFWYSYYLLELSLTILIAILFGLFLGSTLYKMKYFSVKKTWIWFFGGFIWILVSWCPACSITIASYFWLAWIISVFPFWWIELKILSVILLLYVVYVTIRDLEVCKIKK